MFWWAHKEAKVQKMYLPGSLQATVVLVLAHCLGYIILSFTNVELHSSVYHWFLHMSLNT